MKPRGNRLDFIAAFLLIFMLVVGAIIWLLGLIAQQRIFGLLVSAEFVAFALLVYLYYEENPRDLSRKWLLTGLAALAALIVLAAAIVAGVGAPPVPNVQVTLYAGEISGLQYGFGNSSNAITSPGPTLTFTVGNVVNLTLVNAGTMPHDWALVKTKQTSGSVLFHAQIASGTVPIEPNQTGSVVFIVAQAGNFFYICQVPGHVQSGMWGNVVVNP
jgi:uncharacterized cupredoxin-like copper-binding protein